MTEETAVTLKQSRACKVKEGDWLPNLGRVSKILVSGEKIRFYFDTSASREFEISDIVYVDAQNAQRPSRHYTPLPGGKNPASRARPQAIRGVAIE